MPSAQNFWRYGRPCSRACSRPHPVFSFATFIHPISSGCRSARAFDALAEHWAYDLVSLLQDARVDVPPALEEKGKARYISAIKAAEPNFDVDEFEALYAAFGAQRNTRLIGLWVRLLKRDGKPGYLQHMPRTWDYVARNLSHPSLSDLAQWYALHFPEAVRKRPITA
jgi:N-acetylmuramate 1-kinase